MNQMVPREDLDDAAFRARLAPLASEVLPRAPASGAGSLRLPSTAPPAGPSTGPARRSNRGRRRAAIAAIAFGVGCAGGYVAWISFPRAPKAPPAASVATTAPSSAVASVQDAATRPKPGDAVTPTSHSAAPVRADPAAAAAASPDRDMIRLLTRRADQAVAEGDIAAARLLYERAAGLGSAAAATSLGRTYDTALLLRSGVRGITGDPALAASWYREAAALGDPEARALLSAIGTRK